MIESPYKHKLATAEESRNIDAYTINSVGVDGQVLMETAGAKASIIIHDLLADQPGARILILCGKGNNAGDGLVIARHLDEIGYPISICMAAGMDKLSSDCGKNLERIQKLASKRIHITDSADLDQADVIIDAMLGTGLESAPRAPFDSLIKKANATSAIRIALDVPSGINSATGESYGAFFKANHTIQFGTRKLGLIFQDGHIAAGKTWLCTLGFPSEKSAEIRRSALDTDSGPALTSRQTGKHKYENGIVHVIAGSPGMSGAAILCAKAAWYCGTGSVQLHVPAGMVSVYDKQLIQQVKHGYGASDEMNFHPDMVSPILKNINPEKGVVLLGPGLGRSDHSMAFIRRFLSEFTGRIVIDADALYAISPFRDISDSFVSKQVILTPHSGEFSRLLDHTFSTEHERLVYCEQFSDQTSLTLVSKGSPTIISQKKADTYITTYPTTIFGRSGFGDVLAGKIAGYWSISNTATDSIKQALYDGIQRYHSQHSANPENTLDIPDPVHFL